MFNPKDYITKIKGKDYLEVKWRIVWFNDAHPNGAITTEVLEISPIAVVKCSVFNNDGVLLATGHGQCIQNQNAVYSGRELEKAETAAIGRALGHAGFGTQFTDDDEGDFLADSPIDVPQKRGRPAKAKPASDEPTIGDTNKYLFAVIGVWAKFYGYEGDEKDKQRKQFARSNGFKVDSFKELTDEQRIALALLFKQDIVFQTAKQRADGALALDKEQELVAWATNNRKGAKMIEDLSAAECDKILLKWKDAE